MDAYNIYLRAEFEGKEENVPLINVNRWFAKHAAQHSVHLTALRRGLIVSIFINVILLAVVVVLVGGG